MKNEDCDIIDGNRRLTVRKVAENAEFQRLRVHDILSQDLNMSLVCPRWVSRHLTRENLEKRVEL